MSIIWARRAVLASIVILAVSFTSCGGSGSIAEARSENERITDPDVSDAALNELVQGNSGFAFDLYRTLREDGGNLFFSPYSISAALAMTYAGARGETEQEMAETLNFLPQAELHPAFNALDLELAEHAQQTREEAGDAFQLDIANAVWGQQGHEFLAPFLDVLAERYGAGIRLLDFGSEPEEARRTINAWVSDQTEERITELFPKGIIDQMTRLVLANAIYFNAPWADPFPKEQTRDGTFHLLDGTEVRTPMMQLDEHLVHGEVDGVQAVRLPYIGDRFAAYVIMPQEGEFEAFESTLDAEKVEAVVDGISEGRVLLTMPKFELESSFSLSEVLKALGMPSAFNGRADFSGMDGTRGLFIQDVVHKAFVSVDEEGTEAAAATGVAIADSAPPELVVDWPFLFLIRHEPTDTILFIGRVVDPTA